MTAIAPTLQDQDAAIEAAFAGHVTIGAPAAARLLDMDIKTLQRHVAAGHLVGRLKGIGRSRRHRIFTRAAIRKFLEAPRDPTIFEIPEPRAAITRRQKRARPRNKLDNVPAKPRQPGFVYFVSDGQFVKIGWTADWRQRMTTIQSANPNKLQILAVCRGSTYRELALHRRFEKHHTQGEWHRLDQEIRDYIADIGTKGLNCLAEAT